MGEVKGQGHIIDPVSNQCISFLFHMNWTNHFWDMANIVFDLEKNIQNLKKQTKTLLTELLLNLSANKQRNIATNWSYRQANFS